MKNPAENTLKLILLSVAIYRDSNQSKEHLRKMLFDINYDARKGNVVSEDWLNSHGFHLD